MEENGITLINAFEIPADGIDAFVGQWRERAELMRAAPGFRDTRLHRALLPDARFQLVNVAHWDSAEAWRAAQQNPAFRASVGAVSPSVTANPAVYDVVAEF